MDNKDIIKQIENVMDETIEFLSLDDNFVSFKVDGINHYCKLTSTRKLKKNSIRIDRS